MAQIFLIVRVRAIQMFQLQFVIENSAVRPFDTINDVLRPVSLVEHLIKAQNEPIWGQREPTHMRLSETDWFLTLRVS